MAKVKRKKNRKRNGGSGQQQSRSDAQRQPQQQQREPAAPGAFPVLGGGAVSDVAASAIAPLALPNWAAVCAATAGFAAALIAAGSVGLLAHALRHALTWLALAIAGVTGWPQRGSQRRGMRSLALLAAIIAAIAMTASPLPVINILAVVLFVGVLALAQRDENARTVLGVVAGATLVFALYRLAYTSVPIVWYVADGIARAIGIIAGKLARHELRVGASYGGVDFAVATGLLLLAWVVIVPRARSARGGIVIVAVVAAHLLYLVLLAVLSAKFPVAENVPPPPGGPLVIGPPPFAFHEALRSLSPWNLPAIAAVFHLAIAAFVLRSIANDPHDERPMRSAGRAGGVLAVAAVVLALLVPIIATLSFGRCDLNGKKLVFYKEGFLNWLKPEHGEYGRYSIGMYGKMPQYLASLGATGIISPDLSEEDLKDADALVIIFPNKPWKEGQLDRIWKYVNDGGSLMVMGEHTTKEKDVGWEVGGNRYNEILQPTKMRVNFDAAQFAVGGWLQSYQPMAHPANYGVDDRRNEFGVVIGGSVDVHWPAVPILIGTHGWNDIGDVKSERAMLGDDKYNPGERLGDIVLAAEQRVGKGRVILFGDTSGLTNGLTIGAYTYTSRLYGYLASQPIGPQVLWRQILGLLVVGALVLVLLASIARPRTIAGAAVALALSTYVCASLNDRNSLMIPDGTLARFPSTQPSTQPQPRNLLTYMDLSHVGAATEESWRPDGTMGLAMGFMRDGYLVMTLQDFSFERISRSQFVVSVAPQRSFSESEIDAAKKFVNEGGVFILTTSYDHAAGSESLMKAFGFAFGQAGDPRPPHPWGHFKSPYLDYGNGQMLFVRFDAGWPIYATDPNNVRPIAYGPGNKPVILVRTIGSGKFVIVGDAGFAMNKNLEHEGGEPFEGMRENADFWRWFVPELLGQENHWMPPPPPPPPKPVTQPASTQPAVAEESPPGAKS